MTVGQRIAQKRKEQGLSQEALGEALGVSRQSVYKWESGSTLPEIDKLIAMSRLFGVTIGWLLGVEEPAQAEAEEEQTVPPPDSSEPEMTEAQLKMVEEIVDRYLAARQPPKKRRWPWLAGAAAGAVLLAVLISLRGELRDVRNQYDALYLTITSVSRSVDSQIGSITSRVEEVLKSQNNLTASFSVEIASADYAANTVTFSVRAVPKTYTEGMTAFFAADNGETPVEVPAEEGPGQEFFGQVTCALTDGIAISAVFVTGDVRETQTLDAFSFLYTNSLPDAPWPEGDMGRIVLNDEGELWWPGWHCIAYLPNVTRANSVSAYMAGIEQAEARSIRVGLFRNRKLLGWLEPCEQPEYYHGDWNVDFYSFPEVSVIPEEEDIFCLATVVVDEYGREFVYSGVPYVLQQDTLVQANSSDFNAGEPLSPENWEY